MLDFLGDDHVGGGFGFGGGEGDEVLDLSVARHFRAVVPTAFPLPRAAQTEGCPPTAMHAGKRKLGDEAAARRPDAAEALRTRLASLRGSDGLVAAERRKLGVLLALAEARAERPPEQPDGARDDVMLLVIDEDACECGARMARTAPGFMTCAACGLRLPFFEAASVHDTDGMGRRRSSYFFQVKMPLIMGTAAVTIPAQMQEQIQDKVAQYLAAQGHKRADITIRHVYGAMVDLNYKRYVRFKVAFWHMITGKPLPSTSEDEEQWMTQMFEQVQPLWDTGKVERNAGASSSAAPSAAAAVVRKKNFEGYNIVIMLMCQMRGMGQFRDCFPDVSAAKHAEFAPRWLACMKELGIACSPEALKWPQ